ncbi:MAG: multiple sugar transport system substrate-binding protein [Clostridia bacterium]|nr:multiple sugar transport system substrate-binding protein [Clostridia bacterium]
MWRRMIAWFAILIFTLTMISGCGGKSEGPKIESKPDSATSSEPVNLRFPSWQWGQPGYDEFFKAAIAEFQKTHPNVIFEKIPVSSASYVDTLVKMFAANDPPEIVHFQTQLFYKAAEAGWLESLDDRLKQTDIQGNWAPYLLEAGKVGGKTFGVWISGSPIALMYNKKMFAKAKVEVPNTPEEFVAAAKALTKKDANGNVVQFGYTIANKPDVNANTYGLSRFVVGLGGNWGKEGGLDVLNPNNKKAIEFEQDLIKAGVVPLGADRIKAREIFWQGKAAMILEGPWVMTSIKSENPSLLPDVGVALIPFPNQVAYPSNGFAIAKNQKHKEIAWEFIEMITSPEWMKKYGEMAGVTPARTGALSEKALKDYPWLSVFAEVEKSGKNYMIPGLESYQNDIDKIVINRVADVFFGTKSVDDAIREIQADMEKMLK